MCTPKYAYLSLRGASDLLGASREASPPHLGANASVCDLHGGLSICEPQRSIDLSSAASNAPLA